MILQSFMSFSIDGKSDQGAHLMPSFLTGGAWVHVQAFQLFIVDDPEDMGMPGDEQFGRFCPELFDGGGIITGRITADMFHVNRYALALEAELLGNILRIYSPSILP